MKKKIVGMLVCMLIFTTFTGVISSADISTKSNGNEPVDDMDMGYSHTILGEYGTYTGCEPCKYAHRALKRVYAGEYHPFYYVTFVYDKNTHAYQRMKNELGLIASPTVFFDGDYDKKVGASDVEKDMARYNTSIIKCGNRNVADIDLSLDVTWLGAVNNDPGDGAINVSIDGILNWTNAAMNIEVTIDNNEASKYDGHLHVYVTEINSTMWYDKFGDPYTFELKSYAFNEDITISAGDTWSDSTIWDGEHQTDGHGTNFTDVIQSNIMVIASVFDDDDKTPFTDETTGVVAGVGTDPKTYDVYFGDSTPPPKVVSGISGWTFEVGPLSFDTTYYWKIVAWDALGNPTYGDIWSFTTRENNPPNTPSFPRPPDGATGVYINTNLNWDCEDPDGDDVSYDIYFGTTQPPQPPPLFEPNWSDNEYDLPGILLFDTTYYWRIVAWDIFGYKTSGANWSFTTEANLPPNKAINPHPENGTSNVPADAILKWNGSDPNPGDILTYDVYFGRTDPPNKESSNQTENSYDPDDMELHKKYYWRIDTWDSEREKTEGNLWSFTIGENNPPYTPIITGPKEGTTGKKYGYNFSTTDPENQTISYKIDWDDDNVTDWLGPYESGTKISLDHTYSNDGTYTIRCKAKDYYDEESEWGKFVHRSPKSKDSSSMFLYQFLQRFPMLEKLFSLFPVFNRMKGGSQSTEAPLNNDYVNAYWKFDEGEGDTAHDSSGNDYDGTINGATWTSGKVGGALDFDGVNDYVNLDNYAKDLGINKIDDLVFSFYFNTSSSDTGMIYSMSTSSGANPGVHIFLNNGTIGFQADVKGCGFTLYSNGTYNDGKWHYVKIIYHGTTSKPTVEFYVDNEFDNSIKEWVCPFYNDQFTRIKIGRRSHNSTNHFDGLIDELKIIKYSGGNQQPDRPDIDGPTFGLINEKLTYTFVTTDVEKDELYYQIDWDDGEVTPWIGPKKSGEEFTESHLWSENGTYEITARAKDFWHNGWWTYPPFLVSIGNHAPVKPRQPDGPTIGVIDIEYTYSTSTTDEEGDLIYYNWSWGDETFSGWLGPYDSGVTCEASHAWSERGIYKIEVKARDDIGKSLWSDPLNVSIVTPPSIEIGEITGGWFRVKAVIKNTGELDAENVIWNIDLVGGRILSGRNSSGEILSIPAGNETTVKSEVIIGLGKTVVRVTAEIPESSDTEEQDVFVLLFFIKVN